MINIKINPKNSSLKIILCLIISMLIYISTSKIVFSMGLSKNIKDSSSPEEELSIKYCDALNKRIFIGLDNEKLLKYEYYFSSLKITKNKDPEIFFKDFKINVQKRCSYKLNEMDKKEFLSYIKKFSIID